MQLDGYPPSISISFNIVPIAETRPGCFATRLRSELHFSQTLSPNHESRFEILHQASISHAKAVESAAKPPRLVPQSRLHRLCHSFLTMIIQPRIRGFVCTTSHPEGCAQHVRENIASVHKMGPIDGAPKKALVIGASTGYGLSSRITAAFGGKAATLGIFFEKPCSETKPGTAGWYNSAAFEKEATAAGLYATSINGDAFSDEIKQQTIERIKTDLGEVDCVIYSLASPRRTHPRTGETLRSVLKPIDQPFRAKNLNTDKMIVNEVEIEPATDDEIRQTIDVMGGEDWEMWIDALDDAGVLAPNTTTFTYSYIGPEVTWPIYKNGTIGRAKNDLERAAKAITAKLAAGKGGRALVSVNKAVVTQASSAIPVVPLYISLLFAVMKKAGTHEDCIDQTNRLFQQRLFGDADPQPDDHGRIRIDDWEMDPAIQTEVSRLWQLVSTENIADIADVKGYQENFLRLFGFGLKDVDYSASTNPMVNVPSLANPA